MKRFYKLAVSTITAFSFAGFALTSCGGGSSSSSNSSSNQSLIIPLGEEVVGLFLAGPLSGKKAYKLDSSINIPNCWQDSVTWTGSELFYGLSSASFTKLLAGKGLVRDTACSLPRDQINGDYFDIYRAKIVNGA